MSIAKVNIAALKNLLIFGDKYLPQSVCLLDGRKVEFQLEMLFGRMPFEHAVSLRGASLSCLIQFYEGKKPHRTIVG